MFYRCRKSHRKIIHVPGCCHLASKQLEDLIPVVDVEAAFCAGYDMCCHCNPLNKMLRAEEEDIITFCWENGLTYRLHNKYIAVITPKSRWGIAIADNKAKTKLYHHNEKPSKRTGTAFLVKYHDQHVCCSSLLPYFQYIADHDDFRSRHPIQKPVQPRPQKQPPPKKGSKRYRRMLKQEKQREKSRATRKVLSLIDGLHAEEKPGSNVCQTG